MIRCPLFLLPVLLTLPIATADEAAEALVLATYKLAGDGSTATGFVVEKKGAGDGIKRFLITAHHVFNQMKGNSFKLVSRKRKDDGTFSRNEIEIALREDGKNLWKKHKREDLAVLPLPDSAVVEALPFDCIATEGSLEAVHSGDDVRLAVYPEKSEANGAGFPLLRRGSIAGYPILPLKPHPMFVVDTTTWPGDSGGPVIHATLRSPSGGPLVIGIVRGMRSITDTEKESRYVERKTSYPLDIAEVLHAALLRDLIR